MDTPKSKLWTARNAKKGALRENLTTIVVAVLLALVFRSFVFEPFHIPSSSMKGGLLIGDYLFVSKYSYGYSRYSFPFGYAIKYFDGRVGNDARPERGDVVVFRVPKSPSVDYIKRVVGLPGDKIQMMDGVLYINGKPVPKKMIEDFFDTDSQKNIPQYEETLPEGLKYNVLDEDRNGRVDNTQVFTVPEKHYFMMGDNRDNSQDSRYQSDLGFIPEENLVGHARMIALSFGGGSFLRWDRFFKVIH